MRGEAQRPVPDARRCPSCPACSNVAAISLALHMPTMASVPHSVINAYKNVLAIALVTDYSFPLADKVKEILKNPGAFAAAAAAAAPAASAPAAAAAPVVEEESEEEMEMDLFG